MVRVFVTCDTEVWPLGPDWKESGLEREYLYHILGRTTGGDFGVPYQLEILNRHGLKGVFFVEALFADAVGPERLRQITAMVQEAGHEVQLHLHPEWLARIQDPSLPARKGQHLRHYTEDEQTALIARGLANLRASGAAAVSAFRAGNYGGNLDTLRALARNRVAYDTTYNVCYLDGACDMDLGRELLQPELIDGVNEFPVSCFEDWPGHYRHAQLCACSSDELHGALWQASERDWHAFVIVLHSFELIRRPRRTGEAAKPNRIVIRRFEELCRFLAAHRDKFETAFFSDLDPKEIPAPGGAVALKSSPLRTARRMVEQAVSNFF